jgi:hypothetical protein
MIVSENGLVPVDHHGDDALQLVYDVSASGAMQQADMTTLRLHEARQIYE